MGTTIRKDCQKLKIFTDQIAKYQARDGGHRRIASQFKKWIFKFITKACYNF